MHIFGAWHQLSVLKSVSHVSSATTSGQTKCYSDLISESDGIAKHAGASWLAC